MKKLIVISIGAMLASQAFGGFFSDSIKSQVTYGSYFHNGSYLGITYPSESIGNASEQDSVMASGTYGSPFVSTASVYQVVTFNLYWTETVTNEGAPATVYLHLQLNGEAVAMNETYGSGEATCTVSPGVTASSPLKSYSAGAYSQSWGVGPSQSAQTTPGASSGELSYGVTWKVVATLPGGHRVFQATNTISYTTPTAKTGGSIQIFEIVTPPITALNQGAAVYSVTYNFATS
jgi:hypothetical protein